MPTSEEKEAALKANYERPRPRPRSVEEEQILYPMQHQARLYRDARGNLVIYKEEVVDTEGEDVTDAVP